MISQFKSFAVAYTEIVRQVHTLGVRVDPVTDKKSVGSHFGQRSRSTLELLAHRFQVDDPRLREVEAAPRSVNKVFNRANFVWTLTGGGDVDAISSYNERGKVFAKNSAFYEAAFGARLFYPLQQLRSVEERLRSDPSSRRGLAMIYLAEDTLIEKLDTPCAVYLHFMIRDGRLICICNMRSQSALMVLPYDFFLFSMIHELLSVRLEVPLGCLIYTSNSLHVYDDELELAEVVVREGALSSATLGEIDDASDVMLARLIHWEQARRLGADSEHVERLSPYWKNFVEPLDQHFDKLGRR